MRKLVRVLLMLIEWFAMKVLSYTEVVGSAVDLFLGIIQWSRSGRCSGVEIREERAEWMTSKSDER